MPLSLVCALYFQALNGELACGFCLCLPLWRLVPPAKPWPFLPRGGSAMQKPCSGFRVCVYSASPDWEKGKGSVLQGLLVRGARSKARG